MFGRNKEMFMKVAAYQAPFLPSGSMEALALLRKHIDCCETNGVNILCCPEAILGGLADYADDPRAVAINVEGGELDRVLVRLASDSVTTILGFTEVARSGMLYNSAVVFHKHSVLGLYRKRHPAINRSVYSAGEESPVFKVHDLTFGILICNDSNYPELAKIMVSKGARALFILSNTGLASERPNVLAETRAVDIALAKANGLSVIRADVAGDNGRLISYGSSAIIDRHGTVLCAGQRLCEDLLIADLNALTR